MGHLGSYLGRFGSFLAILGPFRGIFEQICGKFNFFAAPLGSWGLLLECLPPMTIQNMRFKQKLVDGPFNPVNIINIPQRLICSISPKQNKKICSALCHVE